MFALGKKKKKSRPVTVAQLHTYIQCPLFRVLDVDGGNITPTSSKGTFSTYMYVLSVESMPASARNVPSLERREKSEEEEKKKRIACRPTTVLVVSAFRSPCPASSTLKTYLYL